MISVAADELLSELSVIQNHPVLNVQLYQDINNVRNKDSIDALLVRTNYRFDDRLLSDFPKLKFIATASAGYDHFDLDSFSRRNISWARSTACNSKSVAEYVFTTLLYLLNNEDYDRMSEKKLGIIGVGACGQQVEKIAQKIGMQTCLYDPPRQSIDSGFKSCSIDELKQANFLTIHVPLNICTKHLINRNLLNKSKVSVVINASRGGVLDESIIDEFSEIDFVLDVWEDEPNFKSESFAKASVRTPHIAGYSKSAKEIASCMAYQHLFNFFNLSHEENIPLTKNVNSKSITEIKSFKDLLSKAHPFLEYEKRLSTLLEVEQIDKRRGFHKIRNDYPLRHEFHEIAIHPFVGLNRNSSHIIEALGFSIQK